MKPDADHQGGRFQMLVEFDMPTCGLRSDLRIFVKDALETWGGQRHPDDPLFSSLGQVTVRYIVKKKKPSKNPRRKQTFCL